MKLVLISDTHAQHDKVKLPEGDVLIHAGDWSSFGKLKETLAFAEWFKSQPHKTKIAVAGNHDWAAWAFMKENREDVLKNIFAPAHYLRDETLQVGGLNFYGSPWQPTFFNWAFNLERGAEIKEKWDQIPAYTDVLITHGPPKGILDRVGGFGKSVGCTDLDTAVFVVRPKVHVFGHIHGGYGQKEIGGTVFANASQCNELYQIKHDPLVVEI